MDIKDFIVYDCEIVNAVPDKGKPRTVGVNYCNGWEDFAGMKISVITAYDARTKKYRVFFEDNFADFQKLIDEVKHVVGFNNIRFDDPLLRANGLNIPKEKSVDIRAIVMTAAGHAPDKRIKGYKLDDICRANNLTVKSGDGAMAPLLWQQGKKGTVTDYCLNDTTMTVELFRVMFANKLLDPVTKDKLNIDLNKI